MYNQEVFLKIICFTDHVFSKFSDARTFGSFKIKLKTSFKIKISLLTAILQLLTHKQKFGSIQNLNIYVEWLSQLFRPTLNED